LPSVMPKPGFGDRASPIVPMVGIEPAGSEPLPNVIGVASNARPSSSMELPHSSHAHEVRRSTQ
jgi:hypothetical protein